MRVLQVMGKEKEYQKINYPTLKDVCQTIWLSRSQSLKANVANFNPLLMVLELEVPELYKRFANIQTFVLLSACSSIVDAIAFISTVMQKEDLHLPTRRCTASYIWSN